MDDELRDLLSRINGALELVSRQLIDVAMAVGGAEARLSRHVTDELRGVESRIIHHIDQTLAEHVDKMHGDG